VRAPAAAAGPWGGAAVCAAVYFAATPVSGWITAAGLPVSLATGGALTALALLGLAYWPAVLAAGWLSAIAMGYPPLMAAPLAAIGLMEALVGMAILRLGRRFVERTQTLPSLTKLVSIALVTLVVPAAGATLLPPLHAFATPHVPAWQSWWMRDAAGLLLLAPLWTLFPHEIAGTPTAIRRAATNLTAYNPSGLEELHQALAAYEVSPKVIVTKNQETPVRPL
jgi:integral membrane sensor domain MASE1